MIEFTIKTSADAMKFLDGAEKKLDNTKPMLAKAGLVMLRSIDKNFRGQGRPSQWVGLAPLTKALRRNKNKGSIKILQDTGRLKGSMTSRVSKEKAEIGTNLDYAPLLHFGGMSKAQTVRIKEHTRRIKGGGYKTVQAGKGKIFGGLQRGYTAYSKTKAVRIKGRRIKVKAYDMHIGSHTVPPRPFVLFQREDVITIEVLGLKHLEDATK
jgi:phage gpG-like protein